MAEATVPKRRYTIADAERLSPTRPVTWRYKRVQTLLGDGKRARHRPEKDRDDEWVCAAYAFRRKWDQALKLKDPVVSDRAINSLFPDYPGLFHAFQLYNDPESQPARIAIESRLLARQDDEKICASLNLIPEVVPWYEALFFNVRERLDSPDYIVRTVLGPILGIGLRNTTEELACKYWSYFGPEFADEIIDGIGSSDSQSLAWWLEKGKAVLTRRYAMSFPFFKIDSYNLSDVLKGFTEMVSIHERALAETSAKTGIEENVSALIGALALTVGQRQQRALVAGTVADGFIGQAVEPRAAQLFDLASGKVPPTLEAVKHKSLPPPRSETDENAK